MAAAVAKLLTEMPDRSLRIASPGLIARPRSPVAGVRWVVHDIHASVWDAVWAWVKVRVRAVKGHRLMIGGRPVAFAKHFLSLGTQGSGRAGWTHSARSVLSSGGLQRKKPVVAVECAWMSITKSACVCPPTPAPVNRVVTGSCRRNDATELCLC
jgi:hypothetical protein